MRRIFLDVVFLLLFFSTFWVIFTTMGRKKKNPLKKLVELEQQEIALDKAEVELQHHGDVLEAMEVQLLDKILREQRLTRRVLTDILNLLTPRLTQIRLRIGDSPMPAGPVTLNVGQSTNATVLGFDQNGQPFTGTMPAMTYVIDNPALDSVTPNADGSAVIVSLAEGTANLTVSATSAEGLSLSDASQIINQAVVVTPVLSSIKLDFSAPTP